MFMLNMMMMTFSILFIFMKHPISLGSILLIQTIITCLIMGLININYWYSYILFIIMIGGLLILFIYMTSIASNEKFKMSNFLLLIFYSLIISMIMMLMMDFYLMNYSTLSISMNNLNFNWIPFFSNKYINYPMNFIFILTIIYLLICLIASVKICSIYKGPMRQNN